VSHPVQQGFIQAFGVVVDTLFVCTATALAILVAGADVLQPGVSAKDSAGTLTQDAIAHLVGEWSRWPMALLIVVLAYTTIIGAFSYAQVCLDYLTDRPGISSALQIGAVICAGVGSVQQLGLGDAASPMGFEGALELAAAADTRIGQNRGGRELRGGSGHSDLLGCATRAAHAGEARTRPRGGLTGCAQ